MLLALLGLLGLLGIQEFSFEIVEVLWNGGIFTFTALLSILVPRDESPPNRRGTVNSDARAGVDTASAAATFSDNFALSVKGLLGVLGVLGLLEL